MSDFLAALKAGSWAPAVTALLSIGVTIGLITADQETTIAAAVTGVAALVSLIVAAVHSVRGVHLVRLAATRDLTREG